MERKKFGIGVIIGEPTGITGKFVLGDNNGIDAGIGWETSNDNKLGVRIPVGLEYVFEDISLCPFLELVPVHNLTPDTDFDLEAGIGIRFFF